MSSPAGVDSIATSNTPSAADRPEEQAAAQPLSLGVCLGWAAGTLGIAVLFNTTNFLLLRFLVDHVAISAAVASAILAAAKVYDAVVNPIVGWVSDRTETRWGRRRPYLFVAGILCALALPILFSPPQSPSQSVLIGYVAFAVFFYATAYTLFNVPYLAMPAEMSTRSDDRSRLMSWRVSAIGAGQLLAGSIAPALIVWCGGGIRGHSMAAWVLGAFVLTACWTAWFSTRNAKFTRNITNSGRVFGVRDQLRAIRQNRPFAILMLTKLLLLGGVAIGHSTLSLFTFHVLKVSDVLLGQFVFANALGIIVSMPFWNRLVVRIGAIRSFAVGAAFYCSACLSFLIVEAGEPTAIVLLRSLLMGIGAGGMILVGQVLLPVTIDYDRRHSGRNQEGVLTGVYSTVERIAFALGLMIAGVALSAMGYEAGTAATGAQQSESAIRAVYFCAWVLPSILIIAGAWALRYFKAE